MLEPALFQNLFNDSIICSLVPNLIPGKIGATLIKVKYTLSIYFKYTSIYLKFTSSRLQVTILEPVELQKKKYYS